MKNSNDTIGNRSRELQGLSENVMELIPTGSDGNNVSATPNVPLFQHFLVWYQHTHTKGTRQLDDSILSLNSGER
jgi:hypothetical protein